MEDALKLKKEKILKRLRNTVESCNCILYEINQEIENMLENNNVLEQTADMYAMWSSKEV